MTPASEWVETHGLGRPAFTKPVVGPYCQAHAEEFKREILEKRKLLL